MELRVSIQSVHQQAAEKLRAAILAGVFRPGDRLVEADLCRRLLPVGKEQVAWEKIATVLVAARLCEPSSELHIAEDWFRRTALGDLLQLSDEEVNKDRLYRALDLLLEHKAALEAHLSNRCGELFSIENEVLLYDVTSTYFEGLAEGNPLAQRGYSRDHRPDCKQVLIALVVTFDGFPLGYEVFAGNVHDSRTLQTIVSTMEARHGTMGRVRITDRGMASAENLAWLRETGRRYIIGAPKSELKKFANDLSSPIGWRQIREDIEVKLTAHPDTGERVILCRSAALPLGGPKNKRCTSSSRSGSRPRSQRSPNVSPAPNAVSIPIRSIDRSAASFSRTNVRLRATTSVSKRISVPRDFGFLSRSDQNSMIGPSVQKAPICCAPTSRIGPTHSSGKPISSSPKRKPPSASRKIS